MSKFINRHQETQVDPVLTRIVEEDKVPWYKKPNLRYLYFMVSSVNPSPLESMGKLFCLQKDETRLTMDSSSPPVWVSS